MNPAAETARLRQGLYRFFSGALAPPTPALLAELTSAADLLHDMDPSRYAFFEAWGRFTGALGVHTADLSTEHVRLFASGAGNALCPPVESFYRSNGGHEHAGEIVAAIEADYRRLGLTVAATTDPPDHLATQLEIMSTLCAREFAAWETGLADEAVRLLADEAGFLDRHLAAWVPHLRSRVIERRPLAYYEALIDAIDSFVIHDRDLIPELQRWTEVLG